MARIDDNTAYPVVASLDGTDLIVALDNGVVKKISVDDLLDGTLSTTDLTAHTGDTSDAHDASAVSVAATPTNYTAGTADVEAHLTGIDTALATAGGGVRVEDEGSSIVAAATGINFAGAGVTVTDAGSNEALVTISSGSGSAPTGAAVATSQTTASTSYVDLTTAGPAVTVTVPGSGTVILALTADIANTNATSTYMGVALSGANTVAAADGSAVRAEESANFVSTRSATIVLTGLTPGSTTFTMKYRVAGGTGTFSKRHIVAFV